MLFISSNINISFVADGALCIGSSSSELDYLISFQPRTKEDFQALSSKIIEYIIQRHQNKPLYHFFVENHVRELAAPLKDVEVRKAATALTTLANEKQREQKEKGATGKKKSKAASKPGLGPAKLQNKCVGCGYMLSILAKIALLIIIIGLIQRCMMRLWMISATTRTISCNPGPNSKP